MNKVFTLLAASALALTAACVPEESNNVQSSAKQDTVNFTLAGFYSWPNGKTAEADPTTIGQDNIVFVVDRSGSMDYRACSSSKSRSDVTIDALTKFLPDMPNDVAAGYVDFGSSVAVRVPIGLNNTISLYNSAEAHAGDMGGTNLTDAIMVAYDMLSTQALAQSSTGTYRMVIVTDGAADNGRSLKKALDQINTTPVEVITAGFCIGGDHVLNQPEDTVYVEASNVDDLVAVFNAAVNDEATDFAVDFNTTSQ